MIDPLERWRRYGEKPDYAGLPSFSGVPYTEDPAELAGADVAIVGAPTDDLVSDRPGARFGPRAIRAASCPPGPHLEAKVDGFAELRVLDYGDAPVLPADPARSHEAIEATVGEVLEAGAIPIVLGGDHGIAEPDIRACAARHGARRPDPLRHPHRHRGGGLRGRGLPRDADVPPGRAGRRRPRPLRPDRPARLLARGEGARLAGGAGDHQLLHARRPRPRHLGGHRPGDRRRRQRPRLPLDRHRRARPGLRPGHRDARAGGDDQRRPAPGRPPGRRPNGAGRGRGRRGDPDRASARPTSPPWPPSGSSARSSPASPWAAPLLPAERNVRRPIAAESYVRRRAGPATRSRGAPGRRLSGSSPRPLGAPARGR